MGLTLMKKIGDFTCSTEIDKEHILKLKEHFDEHVNYDEFLNDVEAGMTDYDDMVVVYYDYLDGGIGSVYAYLSVHCDESDIQVDYGVASEYNGNVEVAGHIPLGEEERLLVALQETIVATTKEFSVQHQQQRDIL